MSFWPKNPRLPLLGGWLCLIFLAQTVSALPNRFGDLDEDGRATILDLVRLINHLRGTPELDPTLQPYADLDHDGVINDADVALLRDAVLGITELPGLDYARVRDTSPAHGEANVSVNRETVFFLTQPLAVDAAVGLNQFFATFGGRRILSRTQVSSDRQTLTLFYLEPLPPSARLRVTLDGAGLKDAQNRPLDPDGDGVPGGRFEIDFDTSGVTPVAGTAVIGRVFASDLIPGPTATNFVNRPLANVTITVDGAEQTLRTTTDATGGFRLSPCPVGRFFVHVDGRTAVGSQWPGGAYYPFVGKAWKAEAGYTNNLAGGDGLIYLPLIPAATLQTLNPSSETTVTFAPEVLAGNPALAGVSLTVPPNSLFSENGTRGGRMGMAAVPPDRLPEPLPPGLSLPLVITVQTDGPQNLDQPARVRFPNLPDPKTGIKLPPGAKTALWSFNHDTGRWEIQGPMTITADGNFAESDPGVGIRQPGWHGTAPGDQGDPPPPPDGDPDPPCKGPTPKPGWNPNDHWNGCGPDGYDYLVPDFEFGEACKQHDIGYSTCNKSKAETDNEFLQNMLAACSGILNPIDRAECIARAHLYYQAVSKGGNGAYQAAQQEACDCYTPPPPPSLAFVPPPPNPTTYEVSGLVYFAVMDTQTKQVIRRGSFAGNPGAMGPTILAPNTTYRLAMVEAATLMEGSTVFTTPTSGQRFQLPKVTVFDPRSWDLDGDGLHDVSELILGTDPTLPDTDGDGVNDGAETQQGGDPLSGQPAVTGIIGAASTSGLAIDICAVNDLAVVADSAAGIVVFNVANRANPVRIASVDTPGNALAVACSGNWVAVADDTFGLAIIDITDPPAAFIRHQVPLGSSARCVVATGNLAYVGLASGELVLVDLSSGTVLERLSVGTAIQDLGVQAETLYVLTVGTLHALPLDEGTLRIAASVNSPRGIGAGGFRLRLFTGGNLAYATYNAGYNLFDLSLPLAPKLIRQNATAQAGWKQIVSNGSGIGVATVSPNSTLDGPHNVSLYNLNPNGTNSQFVTTFLTPGIATAVSLYNGLAYVADRANGMEVINYLSDDRSTNPPSLSLTGSFQILSPTDGVAEEGKLLRLTALAADDVQVRNVEFYLNDIKVLTDGNFPYELRFVSPIRTTESDRFILQAKATDTGGNITWSPRLTVVLVPDATPPIARRIVPAADVVTTNANAIFIYFSELISVASLNGGSFQARYAGPDNRLGTADDQLLSQGLISFRDSVKAAVMEFPGPLAQGLYEVNLAKSVSDPAGNLLPEAIHYTFWIISGGPQGDDDNDGLLNAQEISVGSNPFLLDTDADGWDDGVEFADRTNPLDPASHPEPIFIARPRLEVHQEAKDEQYSEFSGTTVGRPPVETSIIAVDDTPTEAERIVVGRPPVLVIIPDTDAAPALAEQTIVGWPRLELMILESPQGADDDLGIYVGRPPVGLLIQEPPTTLDLREATYLARPPIRLQLQAP